MSGTSVAMSILAVLMAFMLLERPAQADIEWIWEFDSEAGTIVTAGEVACGEVAPPGVYEIVDFAVVDSLFPDHVGSLSGGDYGINQPSEGFVWDGVAPSGWFRASGAFVNGANFNLLGTGIRYGFSDAGYGFDDTDVDPGNFIVFSPVIDMFPVMEACPPPGKTAVCHKGRKTLFVGGRAARAHIRHGDEPGSCP